jgi:hypothetical protein
MIVTALGITAHVHASQIKVSSPLDVTADQFADNEESLGMDPSGNTLAAAWNDWDFNDGCGFSYSTSAGSSWAPRTFVPGFTQFTNDPNVPGTGRFSAAGDPVVVYNPKSGLFDVICQAFGTSTGNQIQLLSTTFNPAKANPNAGENASYGTAAWTAPVAITTGTSNGSEKGSNGKFPDHESGVVDTGNGPGHHFGRLYVGWAEFNGSGRAPIQVAYSDDDGQHWVGPITVSDAGHQFDQDARPSIGPDGSVYMTWTNGPNENSLKNNFVMAARSTDGGNTWTASYNVAPIVAPVAGLLPNSQYRVFSDAWSAVDQTTNQLVVVYNDATSGASNIYAVHALQSGSVTHWSRPLAIEPSAREQFFAWVSAAPNGRIDTAFYDRSCDPADTKNCVTLATTSDGGANWTLVPVLTKGFDGDRYQACLEFVQPANCGDFFLGDYIAVASTNTVAQVLYTGNGPNAMDVYSQRVSF